MIKSCKLILFVALVVFLSSCSSGDTTAPVITLSSEFSANQVLGGMTQNPTGTCVDDVDATCIVHTEAPSNYDGETPGTYTWKLIAEDRAGNVSELEVVVTYTAN